MTAGLAQLVEEILTPSARDEDAYTWAVIGIGHAMLGAAIAAVLGWLVPPEVALPFVVAPGWLALAVGYWWIKERRDLRRGGRWLDGATDALFVGLGAFYGPSWWPLAIFAAVAGGLAARWLLR